MFTSQHIKYVFFFIALIEEAKQFFYSGLVKLGSVSLADSKGVFCDVGNN